MRNAIKRIAILALSAMLLSGTAISAERDRSNPTRQNPSRTAPSRNSSPSKNSPQRTTPTPTSPSKTTPNRNNTNRTTPPRTNPSTTNPNNGQRPGVGTTNNNRPSTSPGNLTGQPTSGQRPGAAGLNRPQGQPGGQQPGQNRPQGNMPGGPTLQPGVPPRHPAGNPPHFAPGPVTPRPPRIPFYVHTPPMRPAPPVNWVMPRRPLSFGEALLGLTLGIAYNASLNYFYSNSYNVSGYANNAIYLNNVEMLNFLWPEVSMFYNGGLLSSSVYTYSTGYNDPLRYNSLLSQLTLSYGTPYISRPASGMTAQWWGPDGNYITLQYLPTYNSMGQLRFYTTLTFGN